MSNIAQSKQSIIRNMYVYTPTKTHAAINGKRGCELERDKGVCGKGWRKERDPK